MQMASLSVPERISRIRAEVSLNEARQDAASPDDRTGDWKDWNKFNNFDNWTDYPRWGNR